MSIVVETREWWKFDTACEFWQFPLQCRVRRVRMTMALARGSRGMFHYIFRTRLRESVLASLTLLQMLNTKFQAADALA